MAYLLPKETIQFWTGQFHDKPPDDLPDYFVFSNCGYREWRFEPLQQWLNRQAIHKKRTVIPKKSPVSGSDTG